MAPLALHPFGLSYYNALIGGLPGAERLGLELTYWNDPVDQVLLDRLAREAHAGATAALAPTLYPGQGILTTNRALARRKSSCETKTRGSGPNGWFYRAAPLTGAPEIDRATAQRRGSIGGRPIQARSLVSRLVAFSTERTAKARRDERRRRDSTAHAMHRQRARTPRPLSERTCETWPLPSSRRADDS